jgi:hypothetical protein
VVKKVGPSSLSAAMSDWKRRTLWAFSLIVRRP